MKKNTLINMFTKRDSRLNSIDVNLIVIGGDQIITTIGKPPITHDPTT